MIRHVVEQTLKSRLVERVIVATDDERIAAAVRLFGGEVMMTPENMRTGTDRIAHVAQRLPDADIVVNVQGDEPLIEPRMIDEGIAPLAGDASLHAGTLVKKITSSDEIMNPNVVKAVLDADGFAIYFSRSPVPYFRDGMEVSNWHALHTYYKHIGLYVFRRDFLLEFSTWEESKLERIEKLEQLRIIEHGYKIKAAVTGCESIPVDTSDDAERVRGIMMKNAILSPQ